MQSELWRMLQQKLQDHWGHIIEPSSRQVMVCRYSSDTTPDTVRWPLVTEFPCLGHLIQNDGGIRKCFGETKRLMWTAFWGNCRHHSLKKASLHIKHALLERCCKGTLSYRCSRWPPQPTIAKELDHLQARMVAAMLRAPRLPAELPADYCRRRNQLAGSHCKKAGTWSMSWFRRALAWHDHIQRGHSASSWPVLMLSFHDDVWLEEQRFRASNRGTNTRVWKGRPAMRWHEGISHARIALANR